MATAREPVNRALALKLIARRHEHSLSQRDLAAILSQPQSFVSKYETGERRLDLAEIHAICRALGISTEQLILDCLRASGEMTSEDR